MSETMTASERARELIGNVKATGSRFGRASVGLDTRELTQAGLAMDDAQAALLAYVARLEACVEAARRLVEEPDGEGHVINISEREDVMRDCLAALDRPEDGETE